MVGVKAVKYLLDSYFFVYGHAQIDPHTGHVSVLGVGGHMVLKQSEPISELPVTFDRVEGDFHCNGSMLTTLQGAPVHVGGYFDCSDNQLKDLVGAPTHVGKHFYCMGNPLTQLMGAPDHVGNKFWLDYEPELPMLRTLTARQGVKLYRAPGTISEILNTHAGTGKSGAIKCAIELIKAGFKGNARW